jgi:Zn-dependent metalloprotease
MKASLGYRIVVLWAALVLLLSHVPVSAAGMLGEIGPTSGVDALADTSPSAVVVPACGGTFIATADTYVNQGAATVANGAATQLRVGRDTRGDERTLLAFDLGRAVPTGVTIQRAELELTVVITPSVLPFPIEAREPISAWAEATTTWNNQPALGPTYGPASYTPDAGVLRVDVTALVARWATGAVSNTGIFLTPVAANSSLVFYSSEAPATGPSLAPRLVIRCAATPEAIAADQTQTDQAQKAGIGLLGAASRSPIQLKLKRGAISHALLEVPAPQNVGTEPLAIAQWFLREHRAALRLSNPDAQMQLTRRSRDGQHLFFRQRYNGIPVFPSALAVHLDGAMVRSLGGSYLPDITLPAVPRLTAKEAEDLALLAALGDGLQRLGDGSVRMADGSVRIALKGDTQLRYVVPSLLGRGDPNTYLAWQVMVLGKKHPATYFVDAFTGKIVLKRAHEMQEFDLEYLYTAQNDTSDACWLFTDNVEWFDEDGVVSGASPDAEGVTAFNNIKAVYNYWKNRFSRDSYDADGEEIEMYVHVGVNWQNAHYSSGCDIFEFGDGYSVGRDVMGHEFTHAVDDSEGELEYESQSGALDESFADIFGHFVDPTDWLIGEDIPGGAIRNMANPSAAPFGDPDHMSAAQSGDGQGLRTLPAGTDPECDTTDPNYNDCGFVHTNSGIHNKVAFLLVDGGVHGGRNVTPIGLSKSERLFYNVLVNRLWDSAQFIDARNEAVAEAVELKKKGTFTAANVCSVKNAYAAVGLGAGDADCDGNDDSTDSDNDNDGYSDGNDNCPNLFNSGQGDVDGDGIGNACDPDIDNDGDLNAADNCQYTANSGQEDVDTDGKGDVCDDSDNDTIMDSKDNCRTTSNYDQLDSDGDKIGDACDNDLDGDGKSNAIDNCLNTYNPGQADGDNDKIGNACDLCPAVSSPDNGDPDEDGKGNPCDPDDDNDGVLDGVDNCPTTPNTNQFDMDGDGVGFACDESEQQAVDKINSRVWIDILTRIPLPGCIQCGGEYIPGGLKTNVNVAVPVGFQARVVNGAGKSVAKGKALAGGGLSLDFTPAPFAVPGVRASGAGAAAKADAGVYYLEILKAPGSSVTGTQTISLTVANVLANRTYLPLIVR